MLELTPRQIVEELDKHIVGQKDAKRAIAVAIRNRWRRQQVEGDMRDEIGPKNMMMIGPTGVGKTEIARRLAALTGAPFVKVDATKYTEVGYYGRDVESMARDLVENAIGIVRAEEREKIAEKGKEAAEKRLLDVLVDKFECDNRDLSEFFDEQELEDDDCIDAEIVDAEQPLETAEQVEQTNKIEPLSFEEASKKFYDDMRNVSAEIQFDPKNPQQSVSEALDALAKVMFGGSREDKKEESGTKEKSETTPKAKEKKKAEEKRHKKEKAKFREKVAELLKEGKLEDEFVPVLQERSSPPIIMGGVGFDLIPDELQNVLENIGPKRTSRRETTVSEARELFIEQESENLLDKEKINERAIELAENLGIIFIDEIDKIVGSEGGRGADVSRQGVQRDLLPIVEGTTVQTKYGFFSTEHVLFIAAGAFHRAKPSDLTPELQGRFPIRVELSELKKEDFVRILTEPKSALTKQYAALMKTENVELVFKDDAIDTLAEYAPETNLTTQNIGARRLCTIMELLLEDLNFEAAEMESGRVEIDADYVRSKLDAVVRDEDLSKFVL